jgi:hypothetical protein
LAATAGSIVTRRGSSCVYSAAVENTLFFDRSTERRRPIFSELSGFVDGSSWQVVFVENGQAAKSLVRNQPTSPRILLLTGDGA